jgi:Glycosyltransferase Family 4
VGDYTRRLAEELANQGHACMAVALNDAYAEAETTDWMATQTSSVLLLRLPAGKSWQLRIDCARRHFEQFGPEWVSLQFVCYGYHPKGLIYGLGRKLRPLLAGKKLHIMFHEVWLCKEMGWGWIQRGVGALQLHFIRQFVRDAKPSVIHTSNAVYTALLNRCRIPATELGLFGNVPIITPSSDSHWISSRLRSALGNGYRREDLWLFGFFGALHPQWPPEPLFTRLRRAADGAGKKPVILAVGRTGEPGLALWNHISEANRNRFGFVHLGEQPGERVSEYLSFLDFGLATTPRAMIGKSGSAISMLEHGLPVIVNRDDAFFSERQRVDEDPYLIPCDPDLERRLNAGFKRGPRVSRRPQTAHAFTSDLVTGSHPAKNVP